jgi:hypothetical protein
MTSSIKRFCLAALLLLVTASFGLGQDYRGKVQGLISDDNGAAVPGAHVVLRNIATGVETTRQTNDDGRYVFDFVDPGEYTILADHDGFKKAIQEHVIVRVFDKQLLLGGDLVNDFMSIVGINDLSRYKRPPRVNQNLANAWIAVVREIDAAHGRQAAKTLVAKLNALASRHEINLAGPTEILPDETIVRLQSEHADGNSRIAREFLWRDDLFPTADQAEVPTAGSSARR